MKNIKRNIHDTLFSAIMKNKTYLTDTLRRLLNDPSIKEEDVNIDNIRHIITTGLYNDLSVTVKNKEIIFLEAQSTWNNNMPLRFLMYIGEYYRQYTKEHEIDVFSDEIAPITIPEFFVIYTGADKPPKSIVSFQDNYPACKSMNIIAPVISAQNAKGILGEYIQFSLELKTLYNKYKKQGLPPAKARYKAVTEAINIFVQNKSPLAEFLIKRKKEITSMLDYLFDQENATQIAIRAAAAKAAKEAENAKILSIAKKMKDSGMNEEDIIKFTGISKEQLNS